MGKVLSMARSKGGKASAPTTIELVSHIHELAVDSNNVGFDHPHIKTQMHERRITMRQALTVLRHGNGIGQPEFDEYGEWRIKMSRSVAGRKVRVVAAATSTFVTVVTVF